MVDIQLIKDWIAALRSGKYKQGKGCLRNGDTFCCLGVAAEVAKNKGIIKDYGYHWVGLSATGLVPLLALDEKIAQSYLWHLNDRMRKSFSEIADYLEEKLLKPLEEKAKEHVEA